MNQPMTSMERVLTAMQMKEPDRVPLFLLCTHWCAKLLDMPIQKYFENPVAVAKGQLRLMEAFNNDCLNPYYSAAHEMAAFGSEIIYVEDGAPNAGAPIIRHPDDILKLQPPDILQHKGLRCILETIQVLKDKVGDSVPIGGGVLAPFTMPILQLGFDKYIEVIYERPELLDHLYRVNEAFCVAWANLQLKAGATFITSIDSMAASSIIPKDIYMRTGYGSAKRTLSQIKSAVAIATSSASTMTVMEAMLDTGVKAFLVSHSDDLRQVKAASAGRATLLGNLNGIALCRMSSEAVEHEVKTAIDAAASGGGFILSDSLGDIPYQVTEETLKVISNSIQTWGRYPRDRR